MLEKLFLHRRREKIRSMCATAPRQPSSPYRGRFAPSPTGPLHFGSLLTALGSYLDARAHGGKWLLRIEDVDGPRTMPSATEHILRTLEAFGFAWDGEVLMQSRRQALYLETLQQLQQAGRVYPCACSRTVLSAACKQKAVDGGLLYPGTCRNGLAGSHAALAWRLRVPDREISFIDRVQGETRQNLECDVGDFILQRADGQYAYQLAVVVDDAAQGINAVVRGVDLLASTPRQIWLQQCLGLPTPSHAHLPVVVNTAGEKLSKQTRAAAVDSAQGSKVLAVALELLGHPVPAELRGVPLNEFWGWAIASWSMARVPAVRSLPQPGSAS